MTLSFWLDRSYTPRQELKSVKEIDFCIIGGGITGVSFAYHLSKLGKKVILIEADTICSKASGRGTGLLIPGLRKRYDLCCQDYGKQKTDALWKLTSHTIDSMKVLSEENHFDCDFLQEGCSGFALNKQDLKQVIVEHSPDTVLLSEVEARAKVVPKALGAIWYKRAATFNPVPFVRGLANLAEEQGALIFEDTLAIDILDQGTHHSIETKEGVVNAKQVIVCTNAWAKDLTGLPVIPIRNQLLAINSFDKIKGGHVSADGRHYFKQTSQGQVILGGSSESKLKIGETDNDDLNEEIQGELVQYLGNLPFKGRFTVTHRWAGILGFTPDNIPIIDKIKPCLYAAVGFSGKGDVLGFLAGKEYSNFLVNGECDLPLEIFSKDRF